MHDDELLELMALIRAKLDAGVIRNQELARRTLSAMQWILDERRKSQLLQVTLHWLR